jgi:hypothetical protein
MISAAKGTGLPYTARNDEEGNTCGCPDDVAFTVTETVVQIPGVHDDVTRLHVTVPIVGDRFEDGGKKGHSSARGGAKIRGGPGCLTIGVPATAGIGTPARSVRQWGAALPVGPYAVRILGIVPIGSEVVGRYCCETVGAVRCDEYGKEPRR